MAPITSSIIMVVGVGGGGGNAVNHMYKQGVADVSFMVCNTDAQALAKSPIPNKIQMGEGLGAGNDPEKGRLAAENSIDEIKEAFKINNTRMVFVTAGMGGGTGTGAAPVIAKAAKELGILTVAIVTIPFESEGRPRIEQAIEGISLIHSCVDSLIIINNAHIVEIYGDLPVSKAFAKADDILTAAAKSISDIITKPHLVNVDFADVKKVMNNSGVAIMGSAIASGDNRAIDALSEAMSSPLLHHKNIIGAKQVLVSITTCEGDGEIKMSETGKITDYIQECSATGYNTNIIWGIGYDETLGEGEIRATVVATGFDVHNIPAIKAYYKKTIGISQVQPTITKPLQTQPQRTVVEWPDEVSAPAQKHMQPEEPSDFVVVDKSDNQPATPVASQSYIVDDFTVDYNASSAPQLTPPEPITTPKTEDNTLPQKPALTPSIPEQKPKLIPTRSNTRSKDIYDMSEEEIDEPAWKRRNMKLDMELPEGAKIQREKLTMEPTSTPKTQTIELDL